MNRREFLQMSCQVGLLTWLGCRGDEGLLLPARESEPIDTDGFSLLARIAHITDTHVLDEESPARFAGAHAITHSAWRPYEAYSAQLFDGIVRMINRIHATGRRIDFVVHTGDLCDNAQGNELAWALRVLDGGTVDPRSGPDDRPAGTRPEPRLDPHTPFEAQGLYRFGEHGQAPSIPYYIVPGNHDVHAIGVFPIIQSSDGRRTAPLPLEDRPGFVLPVRLDPVGSVAHGNVTPADPGPPCLFETPRYVEPNPARAFFDLDEYRGALSGTRTLPAGHGYRMAEEGGVGYSVEPVAGLRLIGLDTNDRRDVTPGYPFQEGAVSRSQLRFLEDELAAARERDEVVIVATHHPSVALCPAFGSEVFPQELQAVLGHCPNVVAQLAGHRHVHRVVARGGYVEIETCSTLDWPQEARLVEIWRDEAGNCRIRYETFTHIDASISALDADPLLALRARALELARADKGDTLRRARFYPGVSDPSGDPADRAGDIFLQR